MFYSNQNSNPNLYCIFLLYTICKMRKKNKRCFHLKRIDFFHGIVENFETFLCGFLIFVENFTSFCFSVSLTFFMKFKSRVFPWKWNCQINVQNCEDFLAKHTEIPHILLPRILKKTYNGKLGKLRKSAFLAWNVSQKCKKKELTQVKICLYAYKRFFFFSQIWKNFFFRLMTSCLWKIYYVFRQKTEKKERFSFRIS